MGRRVFFPLVSAFEIACSLLTLALLCRRNYKQRKWVQQNLRPCQQLRLREVIPTLTIDPGPSLSGRFCLAGVFLSSSHPRLLNLVLIEDGFPSSAKLRSRAMRGRDQQADKYVFVCRLRLHIYGLSLRPG